MDCELCRGAVICCARPDTWKKTAAAAEWTDILTFRRRVYIAPVYVHPCSALVAFRRCLRCEIVHLEPG